MPESGCVLVDGTDLAAVDTTWLRRQIGVVLQENMLFNRSIRDNIALADRSMPIERVIAAAKLAGAHEFILESPEGYVSQILSVVRRKYEGTRLGRQELYAELLEDLEGALWKRALIDALRIKTQDVPAIQRVVVAIDPNASSQDDSNECGIVCAGLGLDGHGYVIEDASAVMAPAEWAAEAIGLYHRFQGDRIIAETKQWRSNGRGDLAHDRSPRAVPLRLGVARQSHTRAEPVSALCEQGRVHHVGSFPRLEDQMCAFTVDFNRNEMGYSPDRVDALVWALTELMIEGGGRRLLVG